MERCFTGKPAPSYQSTPKPGHRVLLDPAEDPSSTVQGVMEQSVSAEDSLSFVTLDGARVQQSADSGVMLNISSITERDEARAEARAEASEAEDAMMACVTKMDDIERKPQDLIHRINHSRAADQGIFSGFENEILSEVSGVCEQVKEQMFSTYQEHNRAMEASLQELSQVLEQSDRLGDELQGTSYTLSIINTGLLGTSGL